MKKHDKRNTAGLKSWKPGQSGNPNGQPKKYVNSLTGSTGYTKLQVCQSFLTILEMTKEELERVNDDEELPMLERVAAAVVLKCHKRATLGELQDILTRVFGQPKQEVVVDAVIKEKQTVILPDGNKLEI